MDFLLELNWVAVGQIILIDLLLGGDNAIVIALACRNLPAHMRMKGILWGTAGAILIRVVLIAFAVTLLQVPYLKLVGGVLLFWIGIKLLADEEGGPGDIAASDKLLTAIKTIVVADLVMSVDNVIAVASAAEHGGGEHQMLLVVFGILVSIPIIIWGSTLVFRMMEKAPIIVTLGAALLGYLAGAMIFSDVGLVPWIEANLPGYKWAVPGLNTELNIPGIVGAIAVVLIGTWKARQAEKQHAEEGAKSS